MPYDYQSILSLMNLMLVACAGISGVGLYRILKFFRCIPGQAPKPARDRILNVDMILASMPEVTYTAHIPNKTAGNDIPAGMPQVVDTAWVPQGGKD